MAMAALRGYAHAGQQIHTHDHVARHSVACRSGVSLVCLFVNYSTCLSVCQSLHPPIHSFILVVHAITVSLHYLGGPF